MDFHCGSEPISISTSFFVPTTHPKETSLFQIEDHSGVSDSFLAQVKRRLENVSPSPGKVDDVSGWGSRIVLTIVVSSQATCKTRKWCSSSWCNWIVQTPNRSVVTSDEVRKLFRNWTLLFQAKKESVKTTQLSTLFWRILDSAHAKENCVSKNFWVSWLISYILLKVLAR